MITLTVFLAGVACVLLLYTVSEVFGLLRRLILGNPPASQPDRPDSEPPPRLIFLVPAHDEELLLPGCLTSLFAQHYPPERMEVVVVADNCSDRTAEIARAHGATVMERHDEARRGKPWAVSWALDRLSGRGFDALVIIDGDTTVDQGFAEALARRDPVQEKVLQPFIGVENPQENALTRMASVYERAMHGIAYRAKELHGLNVPLGVGMCLGRDVLQRLGSWPAFSIAEDHELYVILTLAGERVEAVPEARILAQEASTLKQSSTQRHRWTAGRLHVLLRYLLPVLGSRNLRFHQRLDALAELAWFGPIVQTSLVAVLITLTLILQPPLWHVLVVLLALGLVRVVFYSSLAIVRDPDPWGALTSFAYLPRYAAWRTVRLIRSLFTVGSPHWERTNRHIQER
jgi:1,2-diacylglycerol 3-beta-glucosyltransferase